MLVKVERNLRLLVGEAIEGESTMRTFIACASLAVSIGLIAVSPAYAAGCIKGAVVGGVAGHMAGYHGIAGAAVGFLLF